MNCRFFVVTALGVRHYQDTIIICMLVKCVAAKARLLYPACMFHSDLCCAFLLPRCLGPRANSGSAAQINVIRHIHRLESLRPLRANRAASSASLKQGPPLHTHNYLERHGLSTVRLPLSHSSLFVSLLARLLIWKLFCSLGFMQKYNL